MRKVLALRKSGPNVTLLACGHQWVLGHRPQGQPGVMRTAGWQGPEGSLCTCPGVCVCVSAWFYFFVPFSLCVSVSLCLCFTLVFLSLSDSSLASVFLSLSDVCLLMVRIVESPPRLWLWWEENPSQGQEWGIERGAGPP